MVKPGCDQGLGNYVKYTVNVFTYASYQQSKLLLFNLFQCLCSWLHFVLFMKWNGSIGIYIMFTLNIFLKIKIVINHLMHWYNLVGYCPSEVNKYISMTNSSKNIQIQQWDHSLLQDSKYYMLCVSGKAINTVLKGKHKSFSPEKYVLISSSDKRYHIMSLLDSLLSYYQNSLFHSFCWIWRAVQPLCLIEQGIWNRVSWINLLSASHTL